MSVEYEIVSRVRLKLVFQEGPQVRGLEQKQSIPAPQDPTKTRGTNSQVPAYH